MEYEFKPYKMMKYWTSPNAEVVRYALQSPEYLAQEKIDGASYILYKGEDGIGHVYKDAYSKKNNEIIDKAANVPHIKQFIEECLPPKTQMIAELYNLFDYSVNSETDHSCSTIVNNIMVAKPEKAVKRQQESGHLIRAYVFDVLFYDGECFIDMDCEDRMIKLEKIFKSFTNKPEWLSMAESHIDNKDEFLASILASGGEGVVLKLRHNVRGWSSKYHVADLSESAKRPAHTSLKIKQMDTIDVVILDVEMPEKEYTGRNPETYQYRDADNNPVNRLYALDMIAGFKIGIYKDFKLVEIGSVASGLTDFVRHDAFVNPEQYIGSVIECTCMSIDKTNFALRHPRMFRFRPDKEPEECRWENV